jgi:DNA primase
MDNTVAAIKSKIDIVEFIGQYTTLKKAGRHFTGLCPFHQEKSPSFVVSPDRDMWYCFGACHEGGDVISFLMKWENISFYEALQELSLKTGIPLEKNAIKDQEWEKKDILFKINTMAMQYYQHILHKTTYGEKAREYLKNRGLNDKIVETFQIGYAPESWESLSKFLKAKKFSEHDIARTGLCVKSSRGTYYDRFRGRLVFPIKDIRDNIIGFSGRLLQNKEGEPKYINISETEIYHKRESLYGIHITKDNIRKKNSVILVEGEFDVIMPYQHGVDNLVAIKGSSVTKDHLRILKRYAAKIILSLDADAAGNDAVIRAVREAEEFDLEIYVLKVPDGKDPDEAVRTNEAGFKEALKQVIPAYDFILTTVVEKYPDESPFSKKNIVNELLPFLHSMKNMIVREHYIKKLSEAVETPVEAIKLEIETYERTSSKTRLIQTIQQSRESIDPIEQNQKYLLSYLLQSENPFYAAESIFSVIKPEDFTLPALQKIATAFLEFKQHNPEYAETAFIQSLAKELHPMFDELVYTLLDKQVIEHEDPLRLAISIKEKLLKKLFEKLKSLDEAEADKLSMVISTERIRLNKLKRLQST